MTTTMVWKVLSNNAPSFTELRQMYLNLGGKKDTSGLTKCHLAHMIDELTILRENREDFIKLADDILNYKAKRVYPEDDELYCEYVVGKFKATISIDGCQYNDIIYTGGDYYSYLFEDVSGTFDNARQYLKDTATELKCLDLKWTQIDSTDESTSMYSEYTVTYECKYKGYTFTYRKRSYHENASEDEPSYDEYEEAMYCTDTEVCIAEDWACNDYAVIDYVDNILYVQDKLEEAIRD